MITRRTPVDSPFARIIDRMIDHAAREHGTPAQFNGEFATDTVLPMDVEETASHYLISADLPGVNTHNISIDMHDTLKPKKNHAVKIAAWFFRNAASANSAAACASRWP